MDSGRPYSCKRDKSRYNVIASHRRWRGDLHSKILNKLYFVYIITNAWNTVLYTGVTSDLKKRIFEHKAKVINGFSSKYKTEKLVYFEEHEDIWEAIMREKQIKSGSREKKEILINKSNPGWKDLYNVL